MRLDEARAVFRRWLHLPDTGALDFVLGAVAANRLPGDPVWGLVISPPGGGKTEMLNAISDLDDTRPTGTLTEASLLSGTLTCDSCGPVLSRVLSSARGKCRLAGGSESRRA